MGRWSRQLAPRFLDWLGAADGLDWLEVGCGTGALSAAIVARCHPKSLVSIDPSEGFIATARAMVPDPRARFETGDAQALAAASASTDVVASALVLNFVPDRPKALAEMKRVARPAARSPSMRPPDVGSGRRRSSILCRTHSRDEEER